MNLVDGTDEQLSSTYEMDECEELILSAFSIVASILCNDKVKSFISHVTDECV